MRLATHATHMKIIETPQWTFVPADLDAGDLDQLRKLYEELEDRPIDDPEAAARWLRDESELQSRIGAGVARRYIKMTCETENDAARESYLHLEQNVMPTVKVLADRLDKKLLASPAVDRLDTHRYGVLLRHRRASSEIFREQNTELQKEEAGLQTRQQALMGSLMVEFEGRQHTLQQMAPYYENQDRGLRERAFTASLQARREAWPELDEIFTGLLDLRHRMALNAGFPDYVRFRFVELHRFDYTPETCLEFHRAIEEVVVPIVERLNDRRRKRLGVATLRPWDLEVDPEGQPPFRPFATEDELIGLARSLFGQVDPRFVEEFDILRQEGLLDLMSRKGKAPGGYQYTLEDVRLPFIFANSVGVHQDVQTLLHEGGHAFHAILSRDEELQAYRDAPIEFAETASMAMELMGLEHISSVYEDHDARRVRHKHLESTLRLFPWVASIDAFQHWVYANPGHAPERRRQAWVEIRNRFARDIDYSGIEDALAWQWTGQTHLFNHPLYYVEYGIAQMAALQIWQRYRRDPAAAVEAYRTGLQLGGSRPLPELFAAAGVEFDLSARTLASLVESVAAELLE